MYEGNITIGFYDADKTFPWTIIGSDRLYNDVDFDQIFVPSLNEGTPFPSYVYNTLKQ